MEPEAPFEEPWQGRVFALASAVVETHFAGDREPFRRALVAAIDDDPERPYWESWTVALERLTHPFCEDLSRSDDEKSSQNGGGPPR